MQDAALQKNPSQWAAWLAMLSLCLVQFTVQNEDGHLRRTKALQEQPPGPRTSDPHLFLYKAAQELLFSL